MALKRKQKELLEQQIVDGHGKKWFRGLTISKGRFGSVYLATLKKPKWRITHFPPLMAVKSAEISASALLQKEKVVLDNLQFCPYIRQCFGDEITTGVRNQMIYNLLLEHCSGGTLADVIKKSGGRGLPESDVRRYARCILQGLNCVHQCGYVHCDLKPESILIFPIGTGSNSTEYRVKICDFGLAKRGKERRNKRLDPCYYRGSVGYLSPEVVADKLQEPPSDIWALGCVVLEMLTGMSLWAGKEDWQIEDMLCEIFEEERVLRLPGEVSKEGEDFLRCCLAGDPAFRFTAQMLLNHPFLAVLDEDETEDDQESVDDSEEKVGSPPVECYRGVDQLSSSSSCDECVGEVVSSCCSGESSPSSSLSFDDAEDHGSPAYSDGWSYVSREGMKFQGADKESVRVAKRRS